MSGLTPMNNKPTVDDAIALINQEYFFLVEGGHMIVKENNDESSKTASLETVSKSSFQLCWNIHKFIYTVTKKDDQGNLQEKIKYKMAGDAWLQSKNRRQYKKVVFDTSGKCPKDYYNDWKGFNYKPSKNGSCEIYKDHLLRNTCSGRKEVFDYLWKWFARMIQFPDTVSETAIVIRGEKGAGKNVTVDFVGNLFNGSHFKSFSNRKYITGDFNKQLRQCVFLFSNEAVWAGNQTDNGVLKSMITDRRRTDEAKRQDAFNTQNRIHLIMATNNEWAAPSGWNERRFLVVNIANHNLQDTVFFDQMTDQMEMHGGYERLLWELQNEDLKDFNVMHVPETEELIEQTMISQEGHHAWWLECLRQGYIVEGVNWEDITPWTVIYDHYNKFCDTHRHSFGKKDKSRLASFIRAAIGELQVIVTTPRPEDYYVAAGFLRTKDRQLPHYQLPALDKCRAAFDAGHKQKVKWKPVLKIIVGGRVTGSGTDEPVI